MLQRNLARLLASSFLASFCGATSGHAAELIDVRVDQHGNTTQVVLELDSPAGYRLERTAMQSAGENGELLVTIDAGGRARTVDAKGSLVEEVTVFEGSSDPTVIRVVLREPGLRISDSVLVNPPRLVLKVSRPPNRPGSLPWRVTPAAPDPSPPAPKQQPRQVASSALREVRIGSHPNFSRVVFELDSPVEYRLIRPTSGSPTELLVTLAASAGARHIDSESRYIESVRIEEGGEQTTARVRLRAGNLRVKESTLANPDRIVLDITAN